LLCNLRAQRETPAQYVNPFLDLNEKEEQIKDARFDMIERCMGSPGTYISFISHRYIHGSVLARLFLEKIINLCLFSGFLHEALQKINLENGLMSEG